jgi:hypothetical protein
VQRIVTESSSGRMIWDSAEEGPIVVSGNR